MSKNTDTDRPERAVRKRAAKKGMTPAEQRQRFIDAAREAGCSEVEADFDAALTKIVKPKPKSTS